MIFRDRVDAGRRLAGRLAGDTYEDPVVLALPRGGVPVAAPVAAALNVPLEVFVARKVGAPGHPEFGIGAIAEGSDEVVQTSAIAELGIIPDQLRALVDEERTELARRVDRYRGAEPLPSLRQRDVILVDDGLATGVTAEAALRSLRERGPRRLVLAIPVCSPDAARRLAGVADDVVCAAAPEELASIGAYYDDFSQTTDDEVMDLLASSRSRTVTADERNRGALEVTIAIHDGDAIQADLAVPPRARGIVLFAHGSGSSRHSPRNRDVARALQERGFATLLTDLLTTTEEREDGISAQYRYDIDRLAGRVETACRWLAEDPATVGLRLGLFGASTGAAAALVAAAHSGSRVAAVVSRGGRPDLAGAALAEVAAPTLLIVGGRDETVLGLNQDAQRMLRTTTTELQVIPAAGHLFDEPGALDEVARLAGDWFTAHLGASGGGRRLDA